MTAAKATLNLTALASASMAELLGLLAGSLGPDPEIGPDQLAEYVLAETVRLIRLGTRPELADAGASLSRLLVSQRAEALAQAHPAAHTLLNSAADVLAVAASPASRGGEFAVLRSYSGKALKVLRHVALAESRAVPRAQLLKLTRVQDSYMSHILADLETAGLIERIREGRNVTVHLGPRGYTAEVQRYLQAAGPESATEASQEPIRDRGSIEQSDEPSQGSSRWGYDKLDWIGGLVEAGRYTEALEELCQLQDSNTVPVPLDEIRDLMLECFRKMPRQGTGADKTAPGVPQAVYRRLAMARDMIAGEET